VKFQNQEKHDREVFPDICKLHSVVNALVSECKYIHGWRPSQVITSARSNTTTAAQSTAMAILIFHRSVKNLYLF